MFPIQRSTLVRGCLFLMLAGVSVEAVSDDSNAPDEVRILGWVENAWLIEPGFEVKAKLDTGAATSSLDARVVKRFRQYGKRWIRFAVRRPENGDETIMVRERVRTVGIVQHEGASDVRPIVRVEICIAGARRDVEVSLADRRNFIYPMLIGRQALERFALVDANATFTSDSDCPEEAELNLDEPRPVTDPSAGDNS